MPAQIGQFSKVALIRVRADRGSWAVCDGCFPASLPKADLGPITRNPVPSWHCTHGELDGAKEANGG